MILRQFLHTDPVAASYLVSSGGKASGAVIDPVGDPAPYIEAAAKTGMRILYVIDTHIHADHVSAGRALADASGAQYVLFHAAGANKPFHAVHNGQTLELGNVSLEAMHTPGHTPEHISLLLRDRTRADEPWMVFTGHTLMVGDLGRTELASDAEEGARTLFKTVQRLRAPTMSKCCPGLIRARSAARASPANPGRPSASRSATTRRLESRMKQSSC